MKGVRSILPAMLSLALAVVPLTIARADEKTLDTKVEVVSVDRSKNLITMKDESGKDHTAALLGPAIEDAKSLKEGDKVMVTWSYDDHGSPLGITSAKKTVIR